MDQKCDAMVRVHVGEHNMTREEEIMVTVIKHEIRRTVQLSSNMRQFTCNEYNRLYNSRSEGIIQEHKTVTLQCEW